MIEPKVLSAGFAERFGAPPTLAATGPGRVNLIGEHVDYAGGFVMPCAVEPGVTVVARQRPDRPRRVRAASIGYADVVDLDVFDECDPEGVGRVWARYLFAVTDQLVARGLLTRESPGVDLLFASDLPQGAGLSSSAAFEVAAALILLEAAGPGAASVPPKDLALLAQAAEHGPYVGTRCGIMDQYACALGRRDHALLLDCDALTHRAVPFDSSMAVLVVMNSMKRRGLVDSAYNARRAEAEAGLATLARLTGRDLRTSREATPELWRAHAADIPEPERRRLKHQVTENARTRAFADALAARDLPAAGRLLRQGHASLRDDFEVSCPELDVLVNIAVAQPGCHGARMTGAGFGGCAIALVEPVHAATFIVETKRAYHRRTGLDPECFATSAGDGARVVPMA